MCNQSNRSPFHSRQLPVKAHCKSKGSINLTTIEPRNLGLSSTFAASILVVLVVLLVVNTQMVELFTV